MRSRFGRHALGISLGVVLLVGCGGSQTSMSGAAPQGIAPLVPQQSGNCPPYSGGSGILSDGDFSQAVQPGPSQNGDAVFFKGQIFAPSWIVTKNSIDFVSSTYWNMGGVCSVDLDGQGDPNPVGAIRSNGFATRRGKPYSVTFLLSGNGHCPPAIKTMVVSAAGQFMEYTWNISSGNDAQDGQYAQETWHFIANRPVTNLAFRSLDPKGSGCGAVVAAVAVRKRSRS
jgi:hypothetical protein